MFVFKSPLEFGKWLHKQAKENEKRADRETTVRARHHAHGFAKAHESIARLFESGDIQFVDENIMVNRSVVDHPVNEEIEIIQLAAEGTPAIGEQKICFPKGTLELIEGSAKNSFGWVVTTYYVKKDGLTIGEFRERAWAELFLQAVRTLDETMRDTIEKLQTLRGTVEELQTG